MLKENGYQENISNSHHLHQSQQQSQATDIQEEEIRISINLLCVVGASDYGIYSYLTK